MKKKYIIALEDRNVWSCGVPTKTLLLSDVSIFGTDLSSVNTGIELTPYTEPDLEQVRKEAYEEGFDSGRTLNTGKYEKGLNDAWECARKIINLPNMEDRENIFGRVFSNDVIKDYPVGECIEKIKAYEQEQEELDGLRQNIQTIVDKCGYTLDEIAEVLKKMREG